MITKNINVSNGGFSEFVNIPLVADDIQAYQIILNTDTDLTGCSLAVNVRRADGVVIDDAGTVDGTTATCILKNNMYAVAGETLIRLIIYSADGSKLTSKELIFDAVENFGDADILADDRVPILSALTSQTIEAANAVTEATGEVQTSLSAFDDRLNVVETIKVVPLKTTFISLGINKLNEDDSTDSVILLSDGGVGTYSRTNTSDYIYIPSGQKIIVSPAKASHALYDTSKTYITGSFSSASAANFAFTATQDCYIRVSYNTTRAGTMMLEYVDTGTTTPSAYEEFKYKLNDEVSISDEDRTDIDTKFESIYTDIETINNSLKDYEEIDMTSYTEGYYYYNTGVFTVDTTRHTIKVPCIEGDMFKYTGTISGPVTAMAVYFNSSNTAITYINIPSVQTAYADELITIPSGVAYVAFYSKVGYSFSIKKRDFVSIPELKENMKQLTPSYWYGKKIAWFGTSIPMGSATNNYPNMIGELLGATVYNEAQGSSCARVGNVAKITETDTLGWTGEWWEHIAYGLAMTIAEKQSLIDNWATWQPLLTSAPTTLTTIQQSLILDCSYENRLNRHLSTGAQPVDLFVFDHGHNDLYMLDDYKTIPTKNSANERSYFLGAMNFLIRKILSDNPKARILFIGHYEDARKTEVSECQEILADYWDFPLIKTWEKLGWSQNKIDTTGYWGTNGIWVESGGTSQELTMTQLYMKDDLHPHTDLSGNTNQIYAKVLAGCIEGVR